MSKFEDNLWAELEREHAPELVQSVVKRRRTNAARWLTAAAGVAVLGTAAAIAPAYFGGTPPAYAVVDNPDGTVTLRIRDLTRFEEATAKLREHGVPAVALAAREGCQDEGRLVDRSRYNSFELVDDRTVGNERLLTISRDRIPADATLALALVDTNVRATNGESLHAMFVALYEREHTPSCLRQAPGPGPGQETLPPTGR